MAEPWPRLRVGALYPDLLNIYADRGNLMVITRRCEWRGIEVAVDSVGLGEPLDPGRYDLLYLGGGQDAGQVRLSFRHRGEQHRAM